MNKVREFLGLKKDIVLLLAIIILMLTGEKTWERFLPKYLEEIGGSVFIISGFGFLQNMISSFWSLPGGYIADIIGNKRSFLVFNLMAIGGYLLAIFFSGWVFLFIGLIFFSAWNAISLPASMSMITKSLGTRKTAMGISMHSIIRRIPMIIGPLLGGALITMLGLTQGVKAGFIISIGLCLVAILFQRKMSEQEESEAYVKMRPFKLWKSFDKRLKNLLVSDILIRFCEQIPYVFVIIWCMNYVGVNAQEFGILSAIEMITAALIYIPVASFSDKLERKPFVVVTFIFFTIFPVLLYLSSSFVMLVFAFVIRGLKEFGEPTRKAMILDLSVKNASARTFGLYYFIRDFIVSFAAFAGGWLWSISPSVNLFAASLFGLTGTLFFILFGKGAEREIKAV